MLINQEESQNIEFKEAFGENTLKALSAFANTDGGAVFIGVQDDKTVKGVDLSNKDIEKMTEKIVSKLGIHPSIAYENKILRIEIQKSRVPISCNGKYYKRVGNTTREMQSEELREFFVQDTNWDCITNNYSLEEIDDSTVQKFISMAKKSGRLKAFDDENTLQVLEKLGLLLDGMVTNAAIMVFGKNPQKYFTNAVVRVIRFKDELTSIGDRLITGNLFNQVEEAEETIKNYINVKYEITGKLQRENIWDYPLDAIREMLLNAVIHRDYFKHNIQTQVKILDDHLWCNNAGSLPQGITIDQLKTVHRSIPRNPLIMDIFYRAGFVEEYGSGTQRIIKAFKKHQLPEPEFKEEFNGFSVYFRQNIYTEEKLKELGLNDRQMKAMTYLAVNKKITNKEYQQLNATSKITSYRDLDELSNKGLIKSVGSGRDVHYELIVS